MNLTNRRFLNVLALSFLATTAVASAAAIRSSARPIAGRYIAVLRADAQFQTLAGESSADATARGSREIALLAGGQARTTYTRALRGFAFEGDRWAAENLSRDPRVAYVAEDGVVEVSGGVQTPTPSWGLDRIDQRAGELDGTYAYGEEGAGLALYVVDSGIRATHVDFEGRVDVANAYTAIEDGRGTDDCNGHGTHVAGIVGSASYGVAKGVTLHPVRVVGCDGMGSVSNVLAGIDWLTARHANGANGRAVVNISLNNGYSSALDEAVAASMATGIVYAVAAGNDGDDSACYLSPQRVPGVLTVGASDESGARWSMSNNGPCVDLFAPGVNIVSTFPVDDTSSIAMTGTSMAAPHVAGAVALYLAAHPTATPAEVHEAIVEGATEGELSDVGENTANRLLFASSGPADQTTPDLFLSGFDGGDFDGWSEVVAGGDEVLTARW